MAPRLVADRYELADRLGSGGGGTVWRAHDTSLGRTVAVKEIELAHDLADADREQLQVRALREARAAAGLEHRNVVNVYDVQSTDDAIFIIMEFVDAPSLRQVVDTEGAMAPDEVARIGVDVLSALEAAHAAGIVHRDIKPSNVLVRGVRGAQVTDFGIAAVTDDTTLTMTGKALGTPDYISPEQVTDDGPVGPATDVWSLGATLYHAVEGTPPFRRDRSVSTVHAVVNDAPRPMARAGSLAGVLTQMLAKDPDSRPSVAEARARLAAIADGGAAATTTAMAPVPDRTVRLTQPPPPPPPAPAGTAAPRTDATRRVARQRPAQPRTGRGAVVALVLLVLVVVTALLVNTLASTDPTDTPTDPPETATDPEPPPATEAPSPDEPVEPTTAPAEPTEPEPTETAPETEAPSLTPTDPIETATDVTPTG